MGVTAVPVNFHSKKKGEQKRFTTTVYSEAWKTHQYENLIKDIGKTIT
jgi:lipopolysaccharide biosynthesis protein